MNQQREVIYTRRKRALQGDRLKSEIFDYLDEYVTDVVEGTFDEVLSDQIKEDVLHSILVEFKLEPEEFETLGIDGIKKRIIDSARDFYNKKEEMLGHELMARLERYAMLSVIDHKWKEHLREMDDLKEGIGSKSLRTKRSIG